jgi:hypothetical protein
MFKEQQKNQVNSNSCRSIEAFSPQMMFCLYQDDMTSKALQKWDTSHEDNANIR